eukprot:Phypoly_transcript_19842.p1 GENE.Phypoly_transcript_19842~~Phypoly_transcript_19842.p1  ORF type:complete len:116 (-),score=17.67 Phypoly_transcript_19842:117-464(-)
MTTTSTLLSFSPSSLSSYFQGLFPPLTKHQWIRKVDFNYSTITFKKSHIDLPFQFIPPPKNPKIHISSVWTTRCCHYFLSPHEKSFSKPKLHAIFNIHFATHYFSPFSTSQILLS